MRNKQQDYYSRKGLRDRCKEEVKDYNRGKEIGGVDHYRDNNKLLVVVGQYRYEGVTDSSE